MITTDSHKISKSLCTDADYDIMGWHDCLIYAMSTGINNELILDIDYIWLWVDNKNEKRQFQFWISPCTLAFENVYDLSIDLDISVPFEIRIDSISRCNPQKCKNAEFVNKDIEFDWIIETQQGEISFKSIGYKQYSRQIPRLLDKQEIGIEDRHGISFEKICK
jgi:hypothetical protein